MDSRPTRFAVPVLVLWSLFIWGSRLRNMRDDGEGVGIRSNPEEVRELQGRFDIDTDRLISVGLVVFFLVGALWAFRSAYGLWRDGASDPLTCATGAVLALALGSIVVWPIRAWGTLNDESFSGGFKAVHTLLAVISVVLGLLVLSHRYGRAGHRRSVVNSESVPDPV